jgi:type I restriction enzyme S subunit
MSPKVSPPYGWSIGAIKDLADYFIDGDWIEAPFIKDSGIRLIQTGNVGIGSFLDKPHSQRFISNQTFGILRCKPVRAGDILICRLADPVGRACIVPDFIGPAITAVDCTIFRPNLKLLDPRFGVHWFSSQQHLRVASDRSGGSTRKRISRRNLGSLLVPLPSIGEQRTITDALDGADEKIRSTERLIAKHQQVRRGLLHDLLTCGIGHDGQVRDSARSQSEMIETRLGFMPGSWRILTIGELFEIQLGKMLDVKSFGAAVRHEYLTNRNVQWGRIILDDLERMPFSPADAKKFSLASGDVLVCEGGEVGRCAVWRRADLTMFYQKAIHRLRSRGQIDPDFFVLFMTWLASHNGFANLVGQTSIAHLPKEKLTVLPVRVPELAEQARILAAVSAHDRLSASEDQRASKLRNARQGLMDDLLTGRVRVGALA